MPTVEEREYVDACPSCGCLFIGMTPEEYRETHALVDCEYAPYASLIVFPETS